MSQFLIAAEEQGIGTCINGFVSFFSKAVQKYLGIDHAYSIHGAAVVGYPATRFTRHLVRNDTSIRWNESSELLNHQLFYTYFNIHTMEEDIMSHQTRRPLGITFIIGFFILSIPLWIIGQGIAAFSYETAAELGLQVSIEGMDPALIPVGQGIALGDVILQVPLFALAAIGLWRLRFSGAVVSWLALGTNFYWPIIAWTKQYTQVQAGVDKPFGLGTHGLLAFFFLFSVWASWYLFKKRALFD